ncbi:hypothetical protein [Nocardia sp. NPDC051570]|uniref:hypothetical protein n=1 Tax=Nocardia sp. NPDC051570 TaxID=3364324 RepID=UPI0037BD9B84
MSEFMPNERRKVRGSHNPQWDGIGLFTKGNARKQGDINRHETDPYTCRKCGADLPFGIKNYRRGVWCEPCQHSRSAGEVVGTGRSEADMLAEYVRLYRELPERRRVGFLSRIPKRFRVPVASA